MTGELRLVVADANVYIDAVVHDDQGARRPAIIGPDSVTAAPHGASGAAPARRGTRRTDTGAGPGLVVSDHILLMVVNALRRERWPIEAIRAYAYAIRALAERSAGGYYGNVPRTQHDCPDPEDNLILDVAAHADADLIGTNDSDLLQLGRVHGWKGRPIIDPTDSLRWPTGRLDSAARSNGPSGALAPFPAGDRLRGGAACAVRRVAGEFDA